MAKEDQIIEALEVIKSNIRHIRRRTMRLGRYVNGVLETTVNATLPANYVWVFDPQGDKRVSSPAKNLSTEYGVGMAVIVAYNVDTQEDDVLGVDTILAPMEQGSAAAGLNSPQKPASLPTPTSARDIIPGGVFADSGGGLNVRIGAYWHENGYYADSTALTLVPTVTSGMKSLAVVGVNRLTNAATYTLTANRGTAYTLIANGAPLADAVTDIMAVVDANPHIDWRGAVELKNGDTSVNPAKIVPLNWLKSAMVGADGATAGERGLVPAPAAADNLNFLRGDATWQPVSSGVNGSICLYHADGSDPETFTVDSTGLDDASAAAATGDVIWLPPATITGNHTLTASVEYVGAGRTNTILSGQITGADGATMRTLSITHSVSSSVAIIGLLLTTGTFKAYECNISATNSGAGDAYAVQASGGTLALHDCAVTATASTGTGIAAYTTGGAIYQYDGQRDGSDLDGMLGSLAPLTLATNGTNQAVFPNTISPSAYTYNDVTYVVWLGASFGTYINAYDHAARTWAGAVLVRSNPGSFDDHSSPSLMVDDDGYIHVFFGGNAVAGIPIYHSKSDNPEDISAWTNQTNISSTTTYHGVVKTASGVIYVFYSHPVAGYNNTHYVRSDESYGTEHLAHSVGVAGNGIYFGNPVYDEVRNRIWFMWTYYETAVLARRYMFIAYLDLNDHHWYGGMDDADLGTDTNTTEWVASCQLLSSSYEANNPNLFLDTDGNLHIQYNVKDGGVWKHAYRKWNGTSWGSIELITTANDQFNMGDIHVNVDGTVDAYLVTNATTARGGDLEHWRRSVGGSWSLVRVVFDESVSGADDGIMFPVVNRSDPDGVIRVLFADDKTTGTGTVNDLNIYAINADDAYVTSIPSAYLYLYGVQTVPGSMDTALAGDRAAWDTDSAALHAKDISESVPRYHLPTPSAAGQVAVSVSDGAGGYYWEVQTASAGTVTSVGASAPIASSGGATPTISHNDSGVVAGDYSKVTVNAKGHVTAGTAAQYQQFVYTVGGGTFAFVTDGSGNPIFSLEDVS